MTEKEQVRTTITQESAARQHDRKTMNPEEGNHAGASYSESAGRNDCAALSHIPVDALTEALRAMHEESEQVYHQIDYSLFLKRDGEDE